MASDSYINAVDTLGRAIGAAAGGDAGYHHETEHMTVDQRLQVAQISALLAIAEELSSIAHEGIAQDGQREPNPWKQGS